MNKLLIAQYILYKTSPYNVMECGLDSHNAYAYVELPQDFREFLKGLTSEESEKWDEIDNEYANEVNSGNAAGLIPKNIVSKMTNEEIEYADKKHDEWFYFEHYNTFRVTNLKGQLFEIEVHKEYSATLKFQIKDKGWQSIEKTIQKCTIEEAGALGTSYIIGEYLGPKSKELCDNGKLYFENLYKRDETDN